VKWQHFLARWEGARAENRWGRALITGLLLLLVLLAVERFRKETMVIMQPVTLTQEAWLTQHQAAQSYKEAWGLFLAQLTGNVTPGTARFVQARLKPLLAPAIYHEVMNALHTQVQQILNDRVTLRFEPRAVEYEAATDKIFVTGYAFEKGASSEEHRRERSYEYRIQIAHYAPLIQFMDTYEGKPRTQAVLAQLARQAEQEQGRHDPED
jgi:conjugal transfer pilus assembly protein TraE